MIKSPVTQYFQL